MDKTASDVFAEKYLKRMPGTEQAAVLEEYWRLRRAGRNEMQAIEAVLIEEIAVVKAIIFDIAAGKLTIA